MTKTYLYCVEALDYIFNQLVNFEDQGKAKDFEVRIDNSTVVARTKDLNNFQMFESSINEFSRTVNILFYHGNSRKYDSYNLELKPKRSNDAPLATQEYIEEEINKRLTKRTKKIKGKALKTENKELKIEVNRLRVKNAELEEKQSGVFKEIISLVAAHLPGLNKNAAPLGAINGIELTDLIQMINDRRKTWGDDTFIRVLGVMMTLGDDIQLLAATEQLIQTKNAENEK